MICITKYISENIFPNLSEFPPARVSDNDHSGHIDVGVASFNHPEKALMNSLKTKIDHIDPESNCVSNDYVVANKNNSNGGTPIEYGIMTTFKISKHMRG